jgi:2-polyprenyl-3-methyl-5-hydroxy-6-metoxy-1,4-benzoquinol methylase
VIAKLFRRPDRVAKQVLAGFRGASAGDRLHVRVRWATCPVPEIDAEVPTRGRVLEVGCGHGLVSAYLAISCPDREVVGVDIDERKLVVARDAADRLAAVAPSLRFASSADGAVPPGPWDAVVIVDVLYLLDTDHELALLDACVAELAPGGLLILKETDVVPRTKHRIAKAQEVLATKVLRITEGDALTFTPIAELAAHLTDLGLAVAVRRVDAGYPHPHSLLVGRSVP